MVYIVNAFRTPFSFNDGSLRLVNEDKMMIFMVKNLFASCGVSEELLQRIYLSSHTKKHTIIGSKSKLANDGNLDILYTDPAMGGSMDSIFQANAAIKSKQIHIVIAGGIFKPTKSPPNSYLEINPWVNKTEYSKAQFALSSGRLIEEIVPIPSGGGEMEDVYADEVLANNLFHHAIIGGSLLLLMSEQKCEELQIVPLVKIKGVKRFGDEMIYSNSLFEQVSQWISSLQVFWPEVGLIETNLCSHSDLKNISEVTGIRQQYINQNGLHLIGYPQGVVSARILTTLSHDLGKSKYRYGLGIINENNVFMAVLLEKIY